MSPAHRMLKPSMHQAESPEPEIGWMARIREGDMEAFRLLVEMHQARVIGTISKMLGSDAESEDLASRFLSASGNRHPAINRRQSSPLGCFASPAIWSLTSSDESVTLRTNPKSCRNRLNVRRESRIAFSWKENFNTPSSRRSINSRNRSGWQSSCAVTKKCLTKRSRK